MKRLFSVRFAVSLLLISAAPALIASAQTNEWTSGGPAGTTVRDLAFDPGTPVVVFAATDQGVFRTFDRGVTWALSNTGLINPDTYAIAVDPRTPTTVYAGTSNPVVLHKSLDRGATWSLAVTGLSGGQVANLAIDPARPQRIYAGTPGGIFLTENAGQTWQLAFMIENPSISIDPTNSNVYAAASGGRTPDGGFFESRDLGMTWTQFTVLKGILRPSSIAPDPRNPAFLVAAGDLDKLATSSDRGVHWTIESDPNFPTQILFDQVNPGFVYGISQFGEIVTSADGGHTWGFFKPGLSGILITTLAIDPTGTLLFAGTSGNGVYQIAIARRPDLMPPRDHRPGVREIPPRSTRSTP